MVSMRESGKGEADMLMCGRSHHVLPEGECAVQGVQRFQRYVLIHPVYH